MVEFPPVSLIREKLTITHTDPIHRKFTLELHIRYDGDPGTSGSSFVMVLKRYLPGLVVTDDCDRQLSFLPYHEIEKSAGASAKLILRRKVGVAGERAGASLLWVLLPEPLDPGEVAIIRLSYGDSDPPLKREGMSLIRSPRFKLRERKGAESWNTFIEIDGPPGTEVQFTPREGMPSAPEQFFDGAKSGWRHFSSFVQVRAARGQPDVAFTYRLRPFLSERILIRGTFTVLTLLPASLLLLSILAGQPVVDQVATPTRESSTMPASFLSSNVATNVAAIGIPAMLAITALLPATSVNRLWYGLPLVLYLLVLVFGVVSQG